MMHNKQTHVYNDSKRLRPDIELLFLLLRYSTVKCRTEATRKLTFFKAYIFGGIVCPPSVNYAI